MILHKSVYELLSLLSSRGGRIPDAEVPEQLRAALAVCRGEQLIVPVSRAGAALQPLPSRSWKLTVAGEAAHAKHLLQLSENNGQADEQPGDSLDTPSEEPAKPCDKAKVSLDEMALAIFFKDTSKTKKDIAEILGKPTQSLCPARCPKLDAAMRVYRAPPRSRVRGSKDKEGNLDAWTEEEDDT